MYDTQRLNSLYKKEISGIRTYVDGNDQYACKGFKESQYLVSTMLMQGQGTNQSFLFGLAWLGDRNFELRCARDRGIYPDYDFELALTQ